MAELPPTCQHRSPPRSTLSAPPASPGLVPEAAVIPVLAPQDGPQGGTWLLVNAFGLTVCLLNHYPRGVVEIGQQSRGKIPWLVATAASVGEALDLLKGQNWHAFAPFHLLLVGPGAGTPPTTPVRTLSTTPPTPPTPHAASSPTAWVCTWDGETWQTVSAPRMLTSSSFATVAVCQRRTVQFAELGAEAGQVQSWFQHHDASDGAGSVLMHRPDAATRSQCQVSVTTDQVTLAYQAVGWMRAPTRQPSVSVVFTPLFGPMQQLTLPRRKSPSGCERYLCQ